MDNYQISFPWLCIFFLLTTIIIGAYGKKYRQMKITKCQVISYTCLVVYMLFLLILTVFSREVRSTYSYHMVSWSEYKMISEGAWRPALNIIFNILRLMPIGFFLPMIRQKAGFCQSIIFGTIVSVFIEFMQFVFRRGTFDIVNIFFDMFGVLMGYVICRLGILSLPEAVANKCMNGLKNGIFGALQTIIAFLIQSFLEGMFGEKYRNFIGSIQSRTKEQRNISEVHLEDDRTLMELWRQKWADSEITVEDYFCVLFQHTFWWVKYKADSNRKKNFRAKYVFLAVVFSGFLVYSVFFVWNILQNDGKLQVLLENGFVLILLIMFSSIVAKWIDIKKYQETWSRHSSHLHLLKNEMLMFLYEMAPYDYDDRKTVFRKRILEIWSSNQKKFVDNMETKEKELLDVFRHIDKWKE